MTSRLFEIGAKQQWPRMRRLQALSQRLRAPPPVDNVTVTFNGCVAFSKGANAVLGNVTGNVKTRNDPTIQLKFSGASPEAEDDNQRIKVLDRNMPGRGVTVLQRYHNCRVPSLTLIKEQKEENARVVVDLENENNDLKAELAERHEMFEGEVQHIKNDLKVIFNVELVQGVQPATCS